MPVSLESISAQVTESGRVLIMIGGDVHSEHKTTNAARRWARKMATIKGVDKLFYEHVYSIIPYAFRPEDRSGCAYEEGIRAVIRSRMSALGLDLDTLGSLSGLPVSYLRLLINDRKPVRIDRLSRIILSMGMSFDELWRAVDLEIESWEDVRELDEV